jgi:hypothetical protein
LKAFKKDSKASHGEEDKTRGVKSKLVEKIKAPLTRLKKGVNPQPASQPPVIHKPRFAARNRPQDGRFNIGDLNQHYPSRPKRAKSESKGIRQSNDPIYRTAAREKDEEFLKHGPPELTSLYRPLSINMSKTRKGGEEGIEYYGRYQFEELDFSGMQLFATLEVIDAQTLILSS